MNEKHANDEQDSLGKLLKDFFHPLTDQHGRMSYYQLYLAV